ncbi:MAG: polysaccharide deacetylase family protein [Saprospiraceae bacterium]
MKIIIPNIAVPEVEYTFHCLMKKFLGLEYKLEISPTANDFIINIGSKKLIIRNHFFTNDDPDFLYQKENIPSKVGLDNLILDGEKYSIYSLFGKSAWTETKDEIILEADIIAATFFMLTRWEETLGGERDMHQRFLGKNSLACKNGFLGKPIVNQYVEILWAFFQKINITQVRKKREFGIVPTHDVDIPFLFPNLIYGLRTIVRYLISPTYFWDGVNYLKFYLKGKDPYDTHDIFLDGAEKLKVKAHFFFMAGCHNRFDPRDQLSHPKVKLLLEKIKKRGHQIGFHPSYKSYNDAQIFSQEKKRLEKIAEQKVETGRQHYLRFENPTTWNLWENENMKWDSTMSYADEIGFRNGVCYPFPVFDIFARKKLNLIERPLILMEGTLGLYMDISLEEAKSRVGELMNQVKKYEGDFVFLWHNSSLNFRQYSKYNSILTEIYNDKK